MSPLRFKIFYYNFFVGKGMVIIFAVVVGLFQYIHNLLSKICGASPPCLRNSEESTVNPSWVVPIEVVLLRCAYNTAYSIVIYSTSQY